MTFGSLFAGIGGMDLGLERAGMQCVWQVEINEYCRRVLERHWPNVRRWDDVRTFPPRTIEFGYSWRGAPSGPFAPDIRNERTADDWRVDLICGGFPCQDISNAGLRAGIDGEQSELWAEFARIIRVVRPRYVLVENVAAMLDRGHERVLGDMAEIGFDGEWEVLSACAFGAAHARERVFYIFYPHGSQLRASGTAEDQAGPTVLRFSGASQPRPMANWWATEPEPCSVVYGVPGIVDRLRPYGNAVVPQVAQWIGERIMETEQCPAATRT